MYLCIHEAEFEVPVACNGHLSALVAGYSFSAPNKLFCSKTSPMMYGLAFGLARTLFIRP